VSDLSNSSAELDFQVQEMQKKDDVAMDFSRISHEDEMQDSVNAELLRLEHERKLAMQHQGSLQAEVINQIQLTKQGSGVSMPFFMQSPSDLKPATFAAVGKPMVSSPPVDPNFKVKLGSAAERAKQRHAKKFGDTTQELMEFGGQGFGGGNEKRAHSVSKLTKATNDVFHDAI
jgi:hypothetical protein